MGRNQRPKEGIKRKRCLIMCTIFPVCYLDVRKMDKLQSIYYQPGHLWKRQEAIRKVKELSKKNPAVIKKQLSKQGFCQVHSPPPNPVNRPHYKVMVPDDVHQFDLLYMPTDTLYGNKYKYILSRIAVASRYKVTRPMRMKQVKDIVDMISGIYKVGTLTYPEVFQCDKGSEF